MSFLSFCSLRGTPKSLGSRITTLPRLLSWLTSITSFVDVVVKTTLCFWCSHLHPQRRLAALPRSPVHPLLRAQKDLWRGPDLVGACRLLPAARALRLPFSVRPAPLLAGSFSPLPTERLGNFLANVSLEMWTVNDVLKVTTPAVLGVETLPELTNRD